MDSTKTIWIIRKPYGLYKNHMDSTKTIWMTISIFIYAEAKSIQICKYSLHLLLYLKYCSAERISVDSLVIQDHTSDVPDRDHEWRFAVACITTREV